MAHKPLILKEKLKEIVAEQILDAAEAELAEQGLAATSMASIAQRAGVSVGTIYNYFKDKEVLLATLLVNRRQKFGVHFDEAMRTHEHLPFEQFLEGVIRSVFQIFDQQRNYLRIVLNNETPHVSSGKNPAAMMQFIDRFRPLTSRGVDTGVLDPKDADLYPTALAALIRGVMIQRLEEPNKSFQDATPFVLRVFLDGARIHS